MAPRRLLLPVGFVNSVTTDLQGDPASRQTGPPSRLIECSPRLQTAATRNRGDERPCRVRTSGSFIAAPAAALQLGALAERPQSPCKKALAGFTHPTGRPPSDSHLHRGLQPTPLLNALVVRLGDTAARRPLDEPTALQSFLRKLAGARTAWAHVVPGGVGAATTPPKPRRGASSAR